jgi:ATP-binding cassette subfamily C protein LapB
MYMVRDLDLQMGALIACVMLSSRALGPVAQVANLMSRYHQAKVSLRILNKVMTSPTERPLGKDFLYRPELKGDIALDRVSFSYPGTDRKVLDSVSLSIRAGEKVGIIGRIGSGKSTIARLMMGLYEPEEGTLLADGADYRQIDPADLRRNITCISQDVTLLRGTVRDNIAASAPAASEEEILAAAQAAGAHAFISTHPLGYDAPVGERGDGLSGGQKQCIALARALLLKPKVLICDEPTNAMDLQTEEHFARMIRDQSKNQTLILITHRTSLLPLVERLIVIDGGKVVMDGARDTVLAALSSGKAAGGAK